MTTLRLIVSLWAWTGISKIHLIYAAFELAFNLDFTGEMLDLSKGDLLLESSAQMEEMSKIATYNHHLNIFLATSHGISHTRKRVKRAKVDPSSAIELAKASSLAITMSKVYPSF